jgi:two-component system cell cycle response regulator
MPEADTAVASAVAERLREAISTVRFVLPSGDLIVVTASIGVSSLEGPDDTVEALVARGDEALYRAKHSGRNKVASAAA